MMHNAFGLKSVNPEPSDAVQGFVFNHRFTSKNSFLDRSKFFFSVEIALTALHSGFLLAIFKFLLGSKIFGGERDPRFDKLTLCNSYPLESR